MIVDVNVHLGHYPFRRLPMTAPRQLIQHMDAHGIGVAVVSSLHAVFYRDVQRGNEELFEQTRQHSERLAPIATINPMYVGWQRDLDDCVKQGQARGVALWPEHHGYRLTDDEAQKALAAIAGRQLPLVLTQRLEDRRQRHHWDQAEDLTIEMAAQAAADHPTLKIALCNWGRLDGSELLRAQLRGRVLVDIARLHVIQRKQVPKLIQAVGVESVAFGSHMPFDYVGPALVKLANLRRFLPADYDRFAWRNAAQFFKLDVAP